MRFVPLMLAGSLLLVMRSLTSELSAIQVAPTTQSPTTIGANDRRSNELVGPLARQPDSPGNTPVAGDRRMNGGSCGSAGAAVVTIHAGRSFGSGSIVSTDGFVITNNHVVRPARNRVVGVKTIDGAKYDGQVVAIDPVNDLALIKLNAQNRLPTINLGNVDSLQIGQAVCAIGSPYGQAGVLTRGTLTRVRENGDLQSALLLEPGNSGGPLLNQYGEMIGVNKAIWKARTGENSGISFATNIAIARNFIEHHRAGGAIANSSVKSYADAAPLPFQRVPPLSDYSRLNPGEHSVPAYPNTVTVPSQPFRAGSSGAGTPPSPAGVRMGVVLNKQTLLIEQVEPSSPAGIAGFQVGDRLVAINGNPLQGVEQIQMLLSDRPSSAMFTIERNQQQQTIQVNF